MNVQEVMTKTVWTCRTDEAMSAAARLMWEHDIGALPVLDAAGRLVGIVTDRDLCMSAYFAGEPLTAVPVERGMSKFVSKIEPAQTIEKAEELMRSKRIRRLPVVSGDKLVGMISLADISRAAQTRKAVPVSEVNATLAAIVEPRPASVGAPMSR
jgi:CBS domain-containing protein